MEEGKCIDSYDALLSIKKRRALKTVIWNQNGAFRTQVGLPYLHWVTGYIQVFHPCLISIPVCLWSDVLIRRPFVCGIDLWPYNFPGTSLSAFYFRFHSYSSSRFEFLCSYFVVRYIYILSTYLPCQPLAYRLDGRLPASNSPSSFPSFSVYDLPSHWYPFTLIILFGT